MNWDHELQSYLLSCVEFCNGCQNPQQISFPRWGLAGLLLPKQQRHLQEQEQGSPVLHLHVGQGLDVEGMVLDEPAKGLTLVAVVSGKVEHPGGE